MNIEAVRSGSLIPLFVRWYIVDRPKEMMQLYIQYAQAFGGLFAFTFLLKTLFSPWKNIKDAYPSKGLSLEAIAQTFFLNATTRGIGAAIRLSVIIAGLIVQVALIVGFAVYVLLWVLFPLLVPGLILYLIISPWA